MGYKLKKECESFTVVDGEFAGRTFARATEYETIPPEEKGKFEVTKGFKKDPEPQRGGKKGPPAARSLQSEKSDGEREVKDVD